MKRKQQLQQRKADLVKEAQGILDQPEGEHGGLSEAQRTRHDEIEAELESVNGDLQRIERHEAAERDLSATPGTPLHTPANAKPAIEEDPKRGFSDLADFAMAVRRAYSPEGGPVVDQRLVTLFQAAPTNYHESGGTAGEGYLTPPAFRQEIWDLIWAEDDMLAMVDAEPTDRPSVHLAADETTPWGTSGIQAKWRAEGSQMTADKLDLQGREVRLHELYAFVLATEELLADAPRLRQRLTRKSADAIRWKINEAIRNGDGAGKPKGWFQSGALITQAKESGQSADAIQQENVSKMLTRLFPQVLSRAVWEVHRDALPQLMGMSIANQPVWQPDFRTAPGGVLLGRPVRFSEHAATLGDKGDISLYDPMGYYAVFRSAGMEFADSMHLYFDYNIHAFRWLFRMGGEPYLSAPVSPANGSTTMSHFVTLAERA